MPQQWHFDQDDEAQWYWKREDTEGGSFASPVVFTNQTECMLAAVRFAVQRRRGQIDSGRDDLLQ